MNMSDQMGLKTKLLLGKVKWVGDLDKMRRIYNEVSISNKIKEFK